MNAKLTKGLAAAAISAAMMLGAAAPALAEDEASATVNVTYSQEGVGTRPSETLTYTPKNISVEGSSVYSETNFPELTVEGTKVDSAAGGTVTINLPTYQTVGIYKYELTPKYTVGNDAGVTYDNQHLYVTVTVKQGEKSLERKVAVHRGSENGDKTSDIALKYSTGQLTVTKMITGNLGDTKKAFNFEVELTGPQDKAINGTYHYRVPGSADAKTISFTDGKATVTELSLKNAESIVITDLPAGVKYDVYELNGTEHVAEDGKGEAADGYTLKSVKKSDPTETIEANDKDTETYTNDKTKDGIDTGVLLNNAPYIAIIGGAAVVAIYVVNKRRHSDID